MFRNYLKIAWRNLIKNKAYSLINIGGLALGIAACLLILQYVKFELSYEDFHENKDRIYRVRQDRYDAGKLSTEWAAGAYAVGNKFKEAIPEIEDYVKIVDAGEIMVKVDNRPLKIEKVYFATNSFFSVFSYPLLYGDKGTALKHPNTAAISESLALKLFGSKDVVGQTVEISGPRTYKITGVFKDMPQNTQLQPDFLASYVTFLGMNTTEDSNPEEWWVSDGCLTYLLLKEGISPNTVAAKFPPIVIEHVGELLERFNASVTYSLQPLTKIHLEGNYIEEPSPNGDGKTVYLLLGIAFFILVIAWVNYINLATARAIGRAKEVGVRKAVGSHRKQLIVQFFFESALFNALAVGLALGIILISIPAFNQLSGQEIPYSLFKQLSFWLGLLGLFIFGAFLSGIYPALVLSRFKPVEVLKGKMVGGEQGQFLRKSLVVFQFAASLFLLIGTLTVYRQISFMRDQSLGIDISQTLVIAPPIVSDSTYAHKMKALKGELTGLAVIEKMAVSTTVPGEAVPWNAGGIKLTTQEESAQKQYRVIGTDYDFIDLYGLKLTHGRPFSEDFGSDSESVIFNKAGITQLGFSDPEKALGKRIDFWGNQYTIVGVTDNFHQQSLQEAYEPLILRLIPDIRGYLSIRVRTDQIANTIRQVKTKWATLFPGNTFEYFFLDDHFNAQYDADRKFGSVFGLFTILAILVACLGLFGLASFTAMQRKKEIGIRKVLGASIAHILKLLYREFALLLVLAFVVSIPLAWYATSKWLQGYAFSVDLNWTFFAIPFMTIALVALVTVSFQTLKSALANPVNSLRTE